MSSMTTMTLSGSEHLLGFAVGARGYGAGCRCDDCKQAHRVESIDYSLRRYRAGGPLTVPVERVRIHLLWLRDNGVSYRQIADVVGLSENFVWRTASRPPGSSARISRSMETAILAVTRGQADDTGEVDAELTWRRLHGLMALGWPPQTLKKELGITGRRDEIRLGRHRVKARHARAVAALCRRLGMHLGPSDATRQHAECYGWLVYGSWDDDLNELADSTSWQVDSE